MFPVPVVVLKKRGRPFKDAVKEKRIPKKLGQPYRFNTLDESGNTMTPRDGTLERRGKYINILTKLKKYHKLDFPRREDYEGHPIEVIHDLIEKMREHIRDTKKI